MSVTVRPYRRGGWEVDITDPAARRVATIESGRRRRLLEVGGQRWGEDRERHLLQHGPPTTEEGGAHTRRRSRRDSSTVTHGRTVRSRAASRPRR